MSIRTAETAGFCFGVDRAVNMVRELVSNGKKVCTLGPIIHNPQIVESLSSQGVRIIEDPCEAKEGDTVVIRSHGVPVYIEEELRRLNIETVNATCPFVSKIHRIVTDATSGGRIVLIAGDKIHPEVRGIYGHCRGENTWRVFKDADELDFLGKNEPELYKLPVTLVAQTTFNVEEWKKCLQIVKKDYTNALVFDTICNATALRQNEAVELAKRSDVMIVVGGHHSSNTEKLRKICAQYCETFLVETADELPRKTLLSAGEIGITAGASTPAEIIKEVLKEMTDIKGDAVQNTAETMDSNFEQMLEESLKSMNTDEKVHGVVVGISPTEIYVDVGRKQAGFIPVEELSNEPFSKPEDLVKIGDEMDLLIMRTNDQEGTIMLSKRRLDAIHGWDVIAEAAESKEVLTGVVTDVIKGGIIVVTGGIRVFVPASQATASRNDPLDDLLKKEVKLRVIEVNRQRRRAVGSIRSVLRDERKAQTESFWNEIEEGKEYTGVVKSLTPYGAFVDLGGLDGMIHISELSWTRIKHPSEVVNVGDTVTAFVKSFDREKGKISLGYKRAEDNPWEIMKNQYPVGTECEATIVGMTAFGAFAKIIPGIDGLIHISQIADHRIEKPQDVLKAGETVKVKVTDIDFEKKRVSLSIRALLEAEKKEENEEAPAEEAPVEEAPAEKAPVEEAPAEEAPAEETPAEE